jgi:rubrerythrin
MMEMGVPERKINQKVILFTAKKRFKPVELKVFDTTESELQSGMAICAICGYGSSPGSRWYPVMSTSCCPICGSKNKRNSNIEKK